ncbi:MAG: adenylate/guanylate cyclase domain-containing protein [Rhodospirillales bacterium]|nr:adenylate/guanylate cyclase domain-containing protein [Rhodospirillales bacterium]
MTAYSGRLNTDFQAISDWLIEGALAEIDLEAQFMELCTRLTAAGIPLMRGHLATRALHPMFVAGTATWERSGGRDIARILPEDDDGEAWRASPLYHLLQSGSLEASYDLRHDGAWQKIPLLTELQGRGATAYFAQVVLFGQPEQARRRQDGCILSWASDHPDGFADTQTNTLRWLGSRFGVVAKLHRREQTALNVVSAYLGADAGQRVLDGQIKLGDGEMIPAVIWYCDLRGSTALAENLSNGAFLELLNTYFQCTAGAVLDHGGDVLRFIGDAVLAIFHVDGVDGYSRAAQVAIAAARDAERRLAVVNQQRQAAGDPPVEFGLGLHTGDLMFGNIGIPARVEFSVIGRAANEVARLEGLTKALGHRVLVSQAFADLLPLNWQSVGTHSVAGVKNAMPVFAMPVENE